MGQSYQSLDIIDIIMNIMEYGLSFILFTLGIFLVLLIVGGYIANIVKLIIAFRNEQYTGILALRFAGIFVFILGVIMGFI